MLDAAGRKWLHYLAKIKRFHDRHLFKRSWMLRLFVFLKAKWTQEGNSPVQLSSFKLFMLRMSRLLIIGNLVIQHTVKKDASVDACNKYCIQKYLVISKLITLFLYNGFISCSELHCYSWSPNASWNKFLNSGELICFFSWVDVAFWRGHSLPEMYW